MTRARAAMAHRVSICAALALGGLAACRKPAPPPEPPPIETTPTAGESVAPLEPGSSGGSSDAPP